MVFPDHLAGKAQADSAPPFPGGKKRDKDPVDDAPGNAGSVVGHFNHHMVLLIHSRKTPDFLWRVG